jgi:hypothetical protein
MIDERLNGESLFARDALRTKGGQLVIYADFDCYYSGPLGAVPNVVFSDKPTSRAYCLTAGAQRVGS